MPIGGASIRQGGGLPGRQHFDPLDVHRLLPWIWLVDVQRDPLRFKFRLLGSEQVRAMGRDHTGKWIDEIYPHLTASPSYRHFVVAAEGSSICFRRGEPMFAIAERHVHTERVFLPLARDGSAVDMLLGISLFYWP